MDDLLFMFNAFENTTWLGESWEYEIVWRTGEVRDINGSTVCFAF